MKLLIIDDCPFEYVDGNYYTIYTRAIFFRHLANLLEKVTLLSPVIEKNGAIFRNAFPFDPGKLIIEKNIDSSGFANYYKNYFKNIKILYGKINKLIDEHDILLIIAPTPIGGVITKLCSKKRRPYLMEFTGDIIKGSVSINSSYGIKKTLLMFLGHVIKLKQYRMASRASMIYVLGLELEKELKKYNNKIKVVLDSTILKSDIVYRENTCDKNIVKIIRVGWISHVKGYEYFIMAINELKKKNVINVEVNIVGRTIDKSYEGKILKMIDDYDLNNIIKMTGHLTFERVKELYKCSDINVISSISEGIPRTIIEGAAFGLPLVTTNVGGIPTIIIDKHNGIIVEPGDYISLADSILEVIKNEKLRKNLIKNGYKLAKEHTIEEHAERMIKDLSEILKSK